MHRMCPTLEPVPRSAKALTHRIHKFIHMTVVSFQTGMFHVKRCTLRVKATTEPASHQPSLFHVKQRDLEAAWVSRRRQ